MSLPAKGKALPAMAERRQTSLEWHHVVPSTDQVFVIPRNRVFDHALLTRRGGEGLSKGRVVSDDLLIGAN